MVAPCHLNLRFSQQPACPQVRIFASALAQVCVISMAVAKHRNSLAQILFKLHYIAISESSFRNGFNQLNIRVSLIARDYINRAMKPLMSVGRMLSSTGSCNR